MEIVKIKKKRDLFSRLMEMTILNLSLISAKIVILIKKVAFG